MLALVAAAAAAGAGPAAAQDSTRGLAFRDAHPLTVGLEDLTAAATERRLTVCNEGPKTARGLTVVREGFGFLRDEKPIADASVLRAPRLMRAGARAHVLKPGTCASVRIEPRFGAPVDAGPFTGAVIVSSISGGVARQDLTIDGPPDTAVPAASVADTVQLKVVHKSGPFHFLAPNHGEPATVVLRSPAAGKTLDIRAGCGEGEPKPSEECPSIGAVVHNDETGQIVLAGHVPDPVGGVVRLPVRIDDAESVGDYAGTIDPGLSGAAANDIKTTVSVTDAWGWALVALLLGCALVVGPQLWTRRRRPKSVLNDRAAALVGGYTRAKADFHANDTATHFPHVNPPHGDDVRAYGEDITIAVRNYLKSMVYLDNNTSTYKEIEDSLQTAERDIECWRAPGGLLRALEALRAELNDLQEWVRDRKFSNEDPAVGTAAAQVLAPRRLEIGEATKVKDDADAMAGLLSRWCDHAERLLRLQLWWRELARHRRRRGCPMSRTDLDRHLSAGVRLARVKRQLLDVKDPAFDFSDVTKRLDEVFDELVDLGSKYKIGLPAADADPGELESCWKELGVPELTKDLLMMPSDPSITTTPKLIADAKAVMRTPARPAELESSWRWVGDVVCIVIAIAVALIAALVGIVNGKNFGTPKDYLTVIFFGTAAVGVASGVIPTINAALSDRFGTTLVKTSATEAQTSQGA